MINPELRKYIESEILTKYQNAAGHNVGHINYVITRSLKFAEQIEDINLDMVYVIAAYHDIGRLIDDATHEKLSAYFASIDPNLKRFFNKSQIKIIHEAIEDHRASDTTEPRSIYGKIVSSADRTTVVDAAVSRVVDYYIHLHPENSLDENIEMARKHLVRKYGENGYALTKIYFKDESFELFLQEIRPIMSNHDSYKERYVAIKKGALK